MFSIIIDTTKPGLGEPATGDRYAVLSKLVYDAACALNNHVPVMVIRHPETGDRVGYMQAQTDDPTEGVCERDSEALTAGIAALVASGDTIRAERLKSLLDWVNAKNGER